jgi:niacin transporter
MKRERIEKLATAGLLIAIGMIIPMFSPLKVLIEPASFTVASHVPIFIAMFISPAVAGAVAIGTTIGFFLSGFFPIIVVLRAASHVIYALVGAIYLREISKTKLSAIRLRIFSFCIGVIHALSELYVVSVFYFGGRIGDAFLEHGFVRSALLLVGVGTVIHSMADFEIARLIILPLKRQKTLAKHFRKV